MKEFSLNKLKNWRLRKGLKQINLAKMLGCNQTLISKMENGEIAISSKIRNLLKKNGCPDNVLNNPLKVLKEKDQEIDVAI